MARPKKEIDFLKFDQLYAGGYTDAMIARELGVDRSTVVRRRQALGLPANRKRGQRGPSVRDSEPYWLAVKRSIKYVWNYIIDAARQYYKETGDFERYFICYILEPRPMYHGAPGPHAPDPARMNFTSAKRIVDFEQTMEMTSMAGVPGPAVLELAKVYKSADEETCQRLARQAVETAGLVNCYATVSEVKELINPKDFFRYWKEQLNQAFSWVPYKQWERVKTFRKAARVKERVKEAVNSVIPGRAGKRGKGGGITSIHNYCAYQGALGY